MNIGKRAIALAGMLLACAAVAAPIGSAVAAGKPARTSVTIRVWPQGVFGYVNSPDEAKCAASRIVVVYEQDGDAAEPAADRRVAAVRANPEGAQWAIRTEADGPLYAAVAAQPGCAADRSKVVRSLLGPEAGVGQGDFPSCGPYVSEGTTSICKLDEIYAKLDQEAPFKSCVFSRSSGSCPGNARRGSYPWGGGRAKLFWNWDSHQVQFIAYRDGDTGVAHLGGTMPGPGSADFMVSDGFAQNETGYPNGDHFFTPNLPGARAGEVGGPLNVNFVGGSWDEGGAEIYISGYLYLKQ